MTRLDRPIPDLLPRSQLDTYLSFDLDLRARLSLSGTYDSKADDHSIDNYGFFAAERWREVWSEVSSSTTDPQSSREDEWSESWGFYYGVWPRSSIRLSHPTSADPPQSTNSNTMGMSILPQSLVTRILTLPYSSWDLPEEKRKSVAAQHAFYMNDWSDVGERIWAAEDIIRQTRLVWELYGHRPRGEVDVNEETDQSGDEPETRVSEGPKEDEKVQRLSGESREGMSRRQSGDDGIGNIGVSPTIGGQDVSANSGGTNDQSRLNLDDGNEESNDHLPPDFNDGYTFDMDSHNDMDIAGGSHEDGNQPDQTSTIDSAQPCLPPATDLDRSTHSEASVEVRAEQISSAILPSSKSVTITVPTAVKATDISDTTTSDESQIAPANVATRESPTLSHRPLGVHAQLAVTATASRAATRSVSPSTSTASQGPSKVRKIPGKGRVLLATGDGCDSCQKAEAECWVAESGAYSGRVPSSCERCTRMKKKCIRNRKDDEAEEGV